MPRTSTEVVNAHKEIIKYFKNTYDLDDIPMVRMTILVTPFDFRVLLINAIYINRLLQ